ncbi:MAG: M48 family metallopeptidase [Nesterenkonia sp.]|uniref:M48 metallopeptidase family protein n=1 Tax=Nesterenkonia marinintestina TaxID=2979865 RepID=UPI0021BE61CF|nr:M48 family metallopeptidase [Nesterenkonia sp. GX14115]MDO5493371.1 M48 family metallopeptidase [Nesterenkonia sp.]
MQHQEQLEVDGEPVIVIRSSRRRRTVTADRIDGVLRLRVPLRMSAREVSRHTRDFRAKHRRRSARNTRSDAQLLARAARLDAELFEGRARPVSVRWTDRQTTRWGSTTSADGSIRLSSRMKAMPQWVQDSVLVHELAHLLEPGHGPDFRALVGRWPHTAEADAYLAGVSFGWNNPRLRD